MPRPYTLRGQSGQIEHRTKNQTGEYRKDAVHAGVQENFEEQVDDQSHQKCGEARSGAPLKEPGLQTGSPADLDQLRMTPSRSLTTKPKT